MDFCWEFTMRSALILAAIGRGGIIVISISRMRIGEVTCPRSHRQWVTLEFRGLKLVIVIFISIEIWSNAAAQNLPCQSSPVLRAQKLSSILNLGSTWRSGFQTWKMNFPSPIIAGILEIVFFFFQFPNFVFQRKQCFDFPFHLARARRGGRSLFGTRNELKFQNKAQQWQEKELPSQTQNKTWQASQCGPERRLQHTHRPQGTYVRKAPFST